MWDSDGYAYDDEISTARMAYLHDTGKMCSECGAEFTEANGTPACCEYCKRHGSELPLSLHPEVNVEAIKRLARQRRDRKHRNRL